MAVRNAESESPMNVADALARLYQLMNKTATLKPHERPCCICVNNVDDECVVWDCPWDDPL